MCALTFVFSNLCHNRSNKRSPCVNNDDRKDVRRRIWSCGHDKVRRRDWYGHALVSPKWNYLSEKLAVEEPIW